MVDVTHVECDWNLILAKLLQTYETERSKSQVFFRIKVSHHQDVRRDGGNNDGGIVCRGFVGDSGLCCKGMQQACSCSTVGGFPRWVMH